MSNSISKICFNRAGLPELRFVAQLKNGWNNDSSVFEDAEGKKFVIRRKVYFEGYGTLEREARVCRFLAENNIPFAQKSIYFDSKENLHIVEHVEGDDIGPKDFSSKQAIIFAQQVARLHEIGQENYLTWCQEKNYPEPEIGNLQEFLQGSLLEPGRIITSSCPDPYLVKWAEENIARGAELITEVAPDSPAFVHGDLGGNMKWDGANLHFIDWECAGLRDGTDFGYIFVHGRVPLDMQELILSTYSQCRGLSPEEDKQLREWTSLNIMLQRIDKVVYRAKRYSEAAESNPAEATDFRYQAYQVLKEEFGLLEPSLAPAVRFRQPSHP